MLLSSFGSYGAISLGAAVDPAVKSLQAAVRALGQRVGDAKLQIVADGVMGPRTAAAVNLAFSKYLTNAPVPYRSGKLSQASIKANASKLASYAGGAATGVAVPATVKAAAAKTKTAAVKAVKQAVTAAKSPQIKVLQTALHALGVAVKNKTLQIVADGMIGSKTIAAVNLAMTKYATNAPASIRRGNFTKDEIVTGAEVLAQYIGQISMARGVPPVAAVQKAAPTAKQNGKAVFSGLQQALANLGQLVGDPALSAIVADGMIGPKTVAAVNRAFVTYIAAAYAPAEFKTGRLVAQAVAARASQLTDLVNRENVRRAGAAAPESMPAPVQAAAQAAEEVAAAQAEPQESYMPNVPGAAASPQAAAAAVVQQQQQQQAAQQAQLAPDSPQYMPPGQYAPGGGGGEMAPEDGGGALVPAGAPGLWANMPTAGKVAVGIGVGGAIAGLIYALTRRGGGAGASYARPRRRYA